MHILNLEPKSGKPLKKSLKMLLGIGGLATVIALASTLAANININSGPVEFGQGVAQTTACDDSITVTPRSSFVNGPMPSASPSPTSTPTSTPSPTPTAAFYLESILLSDIDSSEEGCKNKYFTVKAYDNTSSTPLNFYSGVSSIIFFDSGNAFTSNQSGIDVTYEDSTTVSLNIVSPTLTASEVYKITIETSDSSPMLQYVSASSCEFDSIDGETSTAVNSIAEELIADLSGVTLAGDAEFWGLSAGTFESFLREDEEVSFGPGIAVSSGWASTGNTTLESCLSDLLIQSYSNSDEIYDVQAISFDVRVPNNVNGFTFDWIFTSNEVTLSSFDIGAVLVDGRDYALLPDGKVAHVYDGNLSDLNLGFTTAPDDLSQNIDATNTWSDEYVSQAIFDKVNNRPDGSGYSTHRITIAAANTDDSESDSSIFLSNFRR